MGIVVISLGLVTILLLRYIFMLNKSIDEVADMIMSNTDNYINLRVNSSNKHLENLVVKINELYDSTQKVNAENRRIQEEIRRSIANMAHDLRTPLTSVVGYIQLLEDKSLKQEEQKEYLDIIKRRASNLQMLVSSFFDLSRLNSNEYKFNYKMLNLKNILYDILSIYYNDFSSKGIEPIIEIDENISDIILDKDAINRIISNLIGNMIKHGESDFKISLKEIDNKMILSFANKATKLDEEKVKKLFERFYTADASRTDRNTGLGLSIAKALTENLGGRISSEYDNEILMIKVIWHKEKLFN